MANPNARFDIVANAKVAGAFGKVRKEMTAMRRETRAMGAGIRNNRRIIQQAGMQLSDFAVQVGGGQSAILAFTQNVPQFVQGFGAMGGVLAALITIMGTLALVMVKTGTSLNELTPMAGILADEFRMIGSVLLDIKETMIDVANVLINNLDRIAIYAAVVVGLFAAKWVVGFIAARGAVSLLIGSLYALRAILIRLGFAAVVLAIAEVVYQFTRLVKAAGSLGEAWQLLLPVWYEFIERINYGAKSIEYEIKSLTERMKAVWSKALAFMQEQWATFIRGAVVIAKQIPGAGDLALDLNNAAIEAQSAVYTLDQAVAQHTSTAEAWARASDIFGNAALKPIEAIEKLREVMKKADSEGKKIDIRDWFNGGDGDDEKGKGGSTKDALTEAQEKVKSLADTIKSSMSEAFHSMVDGTKSFKDAMSDMAKSVIKKLFDILVVQQLVGQFDASTGTGTGLVGAIMGGLGGLTKSFDGGGFTGSGSRSGGVDGKGGFPAILHPNETVIDHTKPGGGSGSVVVQQTINVSTGVQATVRQEVMSLMPRIAEQAKSAVIEAKKRGGSYGRGF